MKVGITGGNGFVGTHLRNYLSVQKEIEIVSFERDYFDTPGLLDAFVSSCETIVHLAGLNRHGDPNVIYETNVQLCGLLTDACRRTGSKPHIVFSSSTQEEKDNIYGRSKRDGWHIIEKWATDTGGSATSAVIPNVFGPFGHPYYNSVVATFCHQLTHGETPVIQQDGELRLIYVNRLVEEIYGLIKNKVSSRVSIPHQFTLSVSELLAILMSFKSLYLDSGIIPDISTPLYLALFNTFRCYIKKDHFPVPFKVNADARGEFVEIVRANSAGQFSYSTTRPSITRGNHFHTRKAERFAVIKGKARISIRRADLNEVVHYDLDGKNPSFVDMPIWHTHNITNTGEEDLITLFWINEPYREEDPDTFFVDV